MADLTDADAGRKRRRPAIYDQPHRFLGLACLLLICAAAALCFPTTRLTAAKPPDNAAARSTSRPTAAAPAHDAAAASDSARENPAASEPGSELKLGTDWVRLLRSDDGELLGMQTAIVRYVAQHPPKGSDARAAPVVELVGAVHIADAAYYRNLNRRFKQYDVVLYELVAPDGTVVPRGRRASSSHPLGAMQNGIKAMLELEHQLEQIDYTRPNFVHADLSSEQFTQAMKDRGEGFLQMYFRMLGESMARQSEMTAKGESFDLDVMTALFAKDRARRLKMALAKQLADVETLLVGFGGENGSVLISERNKAALKVLKQQLEAGRKRVAIFYGAGHLTDMDQRLRHDFGMKPVSATWLTAWDLAPRP